MGERQLTLKTCTKCGKVKSLSEYYTSKRYSKLKGNYIYYLPSCKECIKKQGEKYRTENEESYRKALKRYQKSEKGKRKHRERSRQRRIEGKHREWQRRNKDKVRQYNFFKVMNKEHDITDAEWNACKNYFNYCCAYCGITEEKSNGIV